MILLFGVLAIFGADFTLTGIALTVMGGSASFDRLELLRRLQPDP